MISRQPQNIAAIIAFILVNVSAASDDTGWISLFNGHDLQGWHANMHPDSFAVEGGILKAHGRHGLAHLFYTGDQREPVCFRDFELEAVVRAEPNSNSGIFFHTSYELRKRRYLNKGYEVQLNSTAREPRKTGSLYDVVDLAKSPVDETKWFKVRLKVKGQRVQVWLNKTQVIDYTEPRSPARRPGREKRLLAPKGGAIAIQAHDPESVFYFRSIRIRRL